MNENESRRIFFVTGGTTRSHDVTSRKCRLPTLWGVLQYFYYLLHDCERTKRHALERGQQNIVTTTTKTPAQYDIACFILLFVQRRCTSNRRSRIEGPTTMRDIKMTLHFDLLYGIVPDDAQSIPNCNE